jgi:transposase
MRRGERVLSVGINPTVFYRWQKQLFEGGEALFEARPRNEETTSARQVAALEEKLVRKNEVVSELLEELVRLKKPNGGL